MLTKNYSHLVYSASRKGRQRDYNPTQWNEYFTEKRDIVLDDKHIFRVYLSQPEPAPNAPLLILLHGGGYSGLSWSLFSVCIKIISTLNLLIQMNC